MGAPIVHVEGANGYQVFLIWRAPASGYESATDTFIFNAQGKIIRQKGVVHDSPPSVQESWDNHFAAFGGQDVDRILFDYTEDSEIIGYDQTSGGRTVSTDLPASAIASPVFSLACPTQVTLLSRRRGE